MGVCFLLILINIFVKKSKSCLTIDERVYIIFKPSGIGPERILD